MDKHRWIVHHNLPIWGLQDDGLNATTLDVIELAKRQNALELGETELDILDLRKIRQLKPVSWISPKLLLVFS